MHIVFLIIAAMFSNRVPTITILNIKKKLKFSMLRNLENWLSNLILFDKFSDTLTMIKYPTALYASPDLFLTTKTWN